MTADRQGEQFLRDFAQMSTFGATERGGLHRLAAGAEHGRVRSWLRAQHGALGLVSRRDRIGNLFGVAELVPGAGHVLVGSHSDSQPTAGRFDGAYGVLAALHAAGECLRRVRAGELEPRRNIAVVDWFNEEGARFQPSLMGSGVFTGRLEGDAMLMVTDREGVSVQEALDALDERGSDPLPEAVAALEVHIEQGRELEDSSTNIGVVTGNWAVRKYVLVVHGHQAHTGATSMEDRHDALLGAAMVVQAVREVADRRPGDVLSSVGSFDIHPNSPVVVASQVELAVDLRSHDEEILGQAHAELIEALDAITARGEVHVETQRSEARPRLTFDSAGVARTERAAERAGASTRRMLTRAGHDSISLQGVMPTQLFFVPSCNGISHSEDEFTSDADLVMGLQVLTEALCDLVATPDLPDERASESPRPPASG